MYLVITIDTEEDNWGEYSPKGSTVENILKVPQLQDLFDKFTVKPTYLVTYPVAKDNKAVSILKGILDKGNCEIGTHCHPWNTPPFKEVRSKRNSMLCNLQNDLQFHKIEVLHNTITDNFGIEPVSFRAGRWAYSEEVGRNIHKLGYKIDTSITPYTNWADNFGPNYLDYSPSPFRYHPMNTREKSSAGYILEIPATIGFLQTNYKMISSIQKIMRQKYFRYLKLIGLAEKLNIMNKVWLCPEFSDSRTMIKLAKTMDQNKFPLINMVFHSSALKAGITPYVKTESDQKSFLRNISEFLVFSKNEGIESITLSEVTKILSNQVVVEAAVNQ